MATTDTENKRRMREYIEAWNDGDLAKALEFFADDYTRTVTRESGAVEELGLDELEDEWGKWFEAFPDLTHEIMEMVAEDEWVLGRLVVQATHEGTYKGIPPTGTEVEFADHFSTRFEDGEIVEHHAMADIYTLLEQLDVTLPPEQTREAENKALVRRYFEALNERDKEAFRSTMGENFTYGDIEGRDEMVESDWEWLQAFDLTWDIQEMYADGDVVTTRVVARGTHQGELKELEPTGETVEVTTITVSRIEDGKIVEWWGEWDFAGLLDQIDAIDVPVYNE